MYSRKGHTCITWLGNSIFYNRFTFLTYTPVLLASLVTQATQTLAVPQPQVPEQASAVSQALPSKTVKIDFCVVTSFITGIYSQAPTTADACSGTCG